MMQELDDDCKSRIFIKYCWTWSEVFVQSFECGGNFFAYVSNPIQCNDVNFNIRTNHRPQKWDSSTTKYWRLAHRQNYKKIAILYWCWWLSIARDWKYICYLWLSNGAIVYPLMLLNVNTYANSVIESSLALMKFVEVLMNVYLPYSFNCWRKWMYILREWTAKR